MKKKVKSIIVPLVAIAFLTSCNSGGGGGGGDVPPGPIPDPEIYNVTCSNDATISNPTATEGTKYITTITPKSGYLLPEKLVKVTVNGDPFTNYAYNTESDVLGHFAIEGRYVTGDINIELVCDYTVTSDGHVELKNRATPSTKYETIIELSDECKDDFTLPTNPVHVKVTIGGERSNNYTYQRKSPTKANFSIDGVYITGPINIDFSYSYTVKVSNGITLSNEIANKGQQYETNLTVPEGYIISENVNQITVEGKVLSTFDYEKIDDTNATLTIFDDDVMGPIDIDLSYVYKVRTDSNDIVLSKYTATPGSDYLITITPNRENVFLPQNLAEVIIDGKVLTNYTYEWISDTEASFLIGKDYVTGPISINLNCSYTVTSVSDVNISKERAMAGENYTTTITPSRNGCLLPESIIGVTVDGAALASTAYTYTRISDTEASFKIYRQFVEGPIDINLACDYVVTIDDHFVLSNKSVTSGTKYETTIQPYSDYYFLDNNISKVTISGEESTNYTFNRISRSEATFSIEAQYVTGPIEITLNYIKSYKAILIPFGGEAITLGDPIINILEDYETTISFPEETYANKKLPNDLLSVTSNGQDINYTYTIDELHPNIAYFKIDKASLLQADVKITIPALASRTSWYDFEDWWNYCSTQKDDVPIATENDIGRIVYVELNGLMHKVRLIDVDHDEIASSDATAHCTFEFLNIITKTIESGPYPEYVVWEEKEEATGTSYNFPESTLNNYLNNNDGCVLNRLPSGLQSQIKTVNKFVALGSSHSVDTPYQTKLFPLAHNEITVETSSYAVSGEGTTYQYYKDHTNKSERIKTMVDDTTEEGKGYWLRSPHTRYDPDHVWYITADGTRSSMTVYTRSPAVAPAFCI